MSVTGADRQRKLEAEIHLTKTPRYKCKHVSEVNKVLDNGIWRVISDETHA